jgi:BirA family biotin operon repressor/biotin-[acetyl-CoA-carboxylase] ligase
VVQWHDELPSTQDVAHRLAEAGAPHGTAVAARVQTAGRGTRSRAWVSSAGGLWVSVVCRPTLGPGIEALGIRIGMGIADLLESALPAPRSGCPPRVLLKWPNDLMLPDGKVGGVLAEARWQGDRPGWIVVGVGVNLHNPLPATTDLPAASLAAAGCTAAPEELAQPVAERVAGLTRVIAPLTPPELAAFAERDWLRGREVLQPVSGLAAGLAPSGRLRIQARDGRIAVIDDSLALRLA